MRYLLVALLLPLLVLQAPRLGDLPSTLLNFQNRATQVIGCSVSATTVDFGQHGKPDTAARTVSASCGSGVANKLTMKRRRGRRRQHGQPPDDAHRRQQDHRLRPVHRAGYASA
jgi:hypothetical protein